MTHFTVLVRTELESGDLNDMDGRITEMLEPYDENTDVPPYKKRITKKRYQEACEYYKIPNSNVATLSAEQFKEWFGADGGKDGRGYFYWSTYNPRSKWDWYQAGGRWQGMLTLKPNAVGNYFKQPNLGKDGMSITEQLKKVKGTDSANVDIAFLKDVDWEGMMAKEIAEITEQYYKAVDWVLAEMEKGKTLDDLAAELYFEYGIENESLEERLARQARFSTHAVVDAHGWHEASKMGWWAVTYDEKETRETWNAKFAERFLSNATEKTAIAVVDCHI